MRLFVNRFVDLSYFCKTQFFCVKHLVFFFIATLFALSSCSVFDLQSKARHAYLNKVPVNEFSVDVRAEKTVVYEPQPDVSDLALLPENICETNQSPQQINTVQDKASDYSAKTIPAVVFVRDFEKTFRTRARAHSADDSFSIDPATLLIWVLVVAIILALLGYLLPVLWTVLIYTLAVVLIIMAILFVVSNL